MPLKDLTGKMVYDLEQEDFEKLFCQHCKDCGNERSRFQRLF